MAKKPKINTLVTMYVNTEFPGLSQNNIKDHVWMGDSNGDVANNNAGKVKDYSTGVLPDGNVTWVPAVINIRTAPKDYVLLTNVVMSDDNDGKIKISLEPDNKMPTHVNGKVSKDANDGETYEYRIYFTVYQDGKDPLELYIDPKITVNR
jgi:hypothetical protein